MHLRNRHIILFLLCLSATYLYADNRAYTCELGVQGGCGYYVGDAATHIFTNVREAYGAHFRYKFDKRWALQVKGLTQTITGDNMLNGEVIDGQWKTPMINMDVMAEFNFFRFGMKEYDKRVKPVTPYIFLGVGCGLYGQDFDNVAAYIPFGIGLKWKFSDRVGLNLAWQHNVYFADNLEGESELGNTYNLNGSNLFNCDLTSQLTLGIVFEFAKEKKICKFCR